MAPLFLACLLVAFSEKTSTVACNSSHIPSTCALEEPFALTFSAADASNVLLCNATVVTLRAYKSNDDFGNNITSMYQPHSTCSSTATGGLVCALAPVPAALQLPPKSHRFSPPAAFLLLDAPRLRHVLSFPLSLILPPTLPR